MRAEGAVLVAMAFALLCGCRPASPPVADVVPNGPPPASREPSAEPPPKPEPPPGWLDEELGASLAHARGLPMIVFVHAAWDMSSKELETTTFADGGVAAELRLLVKVRVDATDDDAPGVAALVTKYRVQGVPTVILFDRSAHEVARVTHFVGAEEMREILRRVR